MMGVGIALACRTNLWNIGAEGQYTMGSIFGGGFALAFPDLPAIVLFPGMLIAAMIGGLFWAGIVVVLKTRINTREILTSLMLTYVAQLPRATRYRHLLPCPRISDGKAKKGAIIYNIGLTGHEQIGLRPAPLRVIEIERVAHASSHIVIGA
ncbi:MAG: ral nucleoside transport system permease protein [Methylobacteriaceae bacterium]|nr:ral nucleoside transport system permease protein [Methylobacteriaceae bacterium]